MEGEALERWKQLCQLIAEEKDPARFTALTQELLEELRKKDERLKSNALSRLQFRLPNVS